MAQFNVPTRDEVSEGNQKTFDNLNAKLGFVPNLYATLAHSDTALGNYLAFQGGKTSLSNKEKEVLNLTVSQANGCSYCQAAHTAIGKLNGFTDDQILDIRRGDIHFDSNYAALGKLVSEIVETKGRPSQSALQAFYDAGYTKGSLIDVVVAIADKVVMNYVHNITEIPVDFPAVPALEPTHA